MVIFNSYVKLPEGRFPTDYSLFWRFWVRLMYDLHLPEPPSPTWIKSQEVPGVPPSLLFLLSYTHVPLLFNHNDNGQERHGQSPMPAAFR